MKLQQIDNRKYLMNNNGDVIFFMTKDVPREIEGFIKVGKSRFKSVDIACLKLRKVMVKSACCKTLVESYYCGDEPIKKVNCVQCTNRVLEPVDQEPVDLDQEPVDQEPVDQEPVDQDNKYNNKRELLLGVKENQRWTYPVN